MRGVGFDGDGANVIARPLDDGRIFAMSSCAQG